jgi:group I intron endonuclease
MTCGIYLIENKKTGQKYIGQSYNIERRWREHLRCKDRKRSYIDNAIHKHGNEKFTLSIICELEKDDDLLNEMEKYYIWKFNTYEDKNHYNLTPGGDFSPMKLPGMAAKISKKLKGREFSEEHRKNISEAQKGKKISEKTKNKISKATSGENNPMFGRHHTESARFKMSCRRNSTGYYRVYKYMDKKCKQGFRWRYSYYDENHKQVAISSVDINKLEEKVKSKGLPWYKLKD